MFRMSSIRSLMLSLGMTVGLLGASFAQAHVALIASTPAAGSTVSATSQLDLVFNEPLISRVSRLEIELIDGESTVARIEHVEVELVNDGKTLRATLHRPLDAGVYHVKWRAVGADSHPMTGDYRFTIK